MRLGWDQTHDLGSAIWVVTDCATGSGLLTW